MAFSPESSSAEHPLRNKDVREPGSSLIDELFTEKQLLRLSSFRLQRFFKWKRALLLIAGELARLREVRETGSLPVRLKC